MGAGREGDEAAPGAEEEVRRARRAGGRGGAVLPPRGASWRPRRAPAVRRRLVIWATNLSLRRNARVLAGGSEQDAAQAAHEGAPRGPLLAQVLHSALPRSLALRPRRGRRRAGVEHTGALWMKRMARGGVRCSTERRPTGPPQARTRSDVEPATHFRVLATLGRWNLTKWHIGDVGGPRPIA